MAPGDILAIALGLLYIVVVAAITLYIGTMHDY